jgi:hypothetical protein
MMVDEAECTFNQMRKKDLIRVSAGMASGKGRTDG